MQGQNKEMAAPHILLAQQDEQQRHPAVPALRPNDDGSLHILKKAYNRALALKALDQRLHAANVNKSTTPAPAVAPMVASINTDGDQVSSKDTEQREETS
jgi:hypothetical protein